MSNKTKTALIVVGLLVAVAGFNYLFQMDPTHLAQRGVGRDPHGDDSSDDPELPTMMSELTAPIGPENADVTLTALYTARGDVEEVLRPMLTAISQQYGEHVRVEFLDTGTEEGQKVVQDVTGGYRSGVLVNGEMIKRVPDAPLGMITFGNVPRFEEWSIQDLRMAIDWELKQKGIVCTHEHVPVEPGAAPAAEGGHVHGPGCSH
ncbi:MAG: hypothetical protein GX131_02090 [candidate division WS1 bacterium]|jgi:hypothetical protein|nr:hypothetical protein [candidate division WS1 bacterium]